MTRSGKTDVGVVDLLGRVRHLQLTLLLLLLVIGSASILTFRSAEQLARESSDVLVLVESLRAEVASTESGLRGFALVERPEFLGPYVQGHPRVLQLSDELAATTSGPDRRLVLETRALAEEWRRDFAEVVIGHLRAGDRAAASALIETGAGKRRTDQMRERLATVEQHRRSASEERRRTADLVGGGGLAAALAILVGCVATVVATRNRLQGAVADPLVALAGTADRLVADDLSARAEVTGVAEAARVALAFNAMADRVGATITELQTLDRLKSQLVSVVSHELRTPLTSIRGSLGLVGSGAMGEIPAEAAAMLTIAVTNTDRLVRLVNDILDLERIEAGDDALAIRPCPVRRIIEDAVGSVSGAADVAGVGIDHHAVDVEIEGDHDRLVQAVTNLLANAVKFSEPGQRVWVDAVAEGKEVVIRVRDDGRGIPSDKLDLIFEPFQQVDASDAREKGGTGLGLSIVRSIVERHGGRVDVASGESRGKGSTFSITLPLPAGARLGRTAAPLGQAVAVLAEDDADLAEVVVETLGQHGIGVVVVQTAADAVAACRSHLPRLLVLDVNLEEGDGFDVVRELRLDNDLRSLTTVVYTVTDLRPPEREALRLGPTRFVTKGQRSSDHLEEIVLDLLASGPTSPDRR